MEGEYGQLTDKQSLADVSVARDVCAWLAVVAKHVDFDDCV